MLLGVPVDPPHCMLEPGTPGMIAVQEDGTLVLVPFEGFYCNVPDHHQLEDEIAALKVKGYFTINFGFQENPGGLQTFCFLKTKIAPFVR